MILLYTANNASYNNKPLIDRPTISEIKVEKSMIPVLEIFVFSSLKNDLIATYNTPAIRNLIKATFPKNTPVIIAIIKNGIISGTLIVFIAANIAIPNGVAPEINFEEAIKAHKK